MKAIEDPGRKQDEALNPAIYPAEHLLKELVQKMLKIMKLRKFGNDLENKEANLEKQLSESNKRNYWKGIWQHNEFNRGIIQNGHYIYEFWKK